MGCQQSQGCAYADAVEETIDARHAHHVQADVVKVDVALPSSLTSTAERMMRHSGPGPFSDEKHYPNSSSGCESTTASSTGHLDNTEGSESSTGRLDLLEIVGSGSFAKVYRAVASDAGKQVDVAVKVVEISTAYNPSASSQNDAKGQHRTKYTMPKHAVEKEVSILEMVAGRPNCLQLLAYFEEKNMGHLVSEYCSSTLVDILEWMPELRASTIRNAAKQMLQGLASAHSAGVVHRDVKPDNFLCQITSSNGPHQMPQFLVKLCDFGLAAVEEDGQMRAVCGTAPFMSPEMVSRKCYDSKTDVWSFGVVMHTLLLGRFPYTSKERTPNGVKDAIRLGKEKLTFEPAAGTFEGSKPAVLKTSAQFLSVLLERKPLLRASAVEALEHPWLNHQEKDDAFSFTASFAMAKKLGVFTGGDAARKNAGRSRTTAGSVALSKSPLSSARNANSTGLAVVGEPETMSFEVGVLRNASKRATTATTTTTSTTTTQAHIQSQDLESTERAVI